MDSTIMKYLGRTKLQMAILVVLLVIANKYFNLGLDHQQLTTAIYGLIAYICGQSIVDAIGQWPGGPPPVSGDPPPPQPQK